MGGSAGKLYQALKHPEDEKKLKASFQNYDKDKSGVLERVELQKVNATSISPACSRAELQKVQRSAGVFSPLF
jgi:Ca2+-binding EF-hand superfamily protein